VGKHALKGLFVWGICNADWSSEAAMYTRDVYCLCQCRAIDCHQRVGEKQESVGVGMGPGTQNSNPVG
jgi:hypothetical protein